MNPVATIGYEGATIERFLEALIDAEITCLVDVRAVPVSRKKGFSKRQLEQRLAEVGIRYVSLKGLGDPKPGRDAARAGNYNDFRRIYRRHLETDVAQVDLKAVLELAYADNICMLCYEKNPTECHRSLVAGEMRRLGGLEIDHLYVEGVGKSDRTVDRRSSDSREGRAAAEC
jgi:uncharacterized protein (DUF488 family)